MRGRCCWSVPNYSEEGLSLLRKRLDNQMEKHMSSDALCDIAEVVLKNNFFKFGKKTLKQKTGTAIGTKLAPPYRRGNS